MTSDILFFLALSLALGFKHAYDADHLVAVSNFLTRSKTIKETARMTVSWALGHMLTAAIITVILFTTATQTQVLSEILSHFESAVAIMLIAIGVLGIALEIPIINKHLPKSMTSHADAHLTKGVHHHLFGVGVIHGLASNDELLALFVAGLGIGSLTFLLAGLLVFTIGVMMGMIIFGACFTYPLFQNNAQRAKLIIAVVAGTLSIVYGVLLLTGIEGINIVELFLH